MSSEILSRPRFEGSNICTWIGFKHVMYLIEEAVLEHLRRHGMSPRELYERQGLGVEIVDSDVRIATAVHLDDLVRTEVEPQPSENDGEVLVFKTASYVDAVRAATATVRVRLDPTTEVGTPRLALNETVLDGRGSVQDVAGTNAIVWRWRIPYFYCHYSQRLQHSGYLRLMEEVVDVFLARRGISIRDMLAGRRWIPVVPSARVRILEPAFMEETSTPSSPWRTSTRTCFTPPAWIVTYLATTIWYRPRRAGSRTGTPKWWTVVIGGTCRSTKRPWQRCGRKPPIRFQNRRREHVY
jgi:acyl-CoA thioesterase FadM